MTRLFDRFPSVSADRVTYFIHDYIGRIDWSCPQLNGDIVTANRTNRRSDVTDHYEVPIP